MTCTSCKQRLSAYLDGELGDGEASALRGHLRTCAACSACAAREAEAIDGLRQLPSIDPPPAMWQAIRNQLAHEEIADAEAPLSARLWRKLAPWLPRGAGGLAVASAAVLLLWWARSPGTPSGKDLAGSGAGPVAEALATPATPATPATIGGQPPSAPPLDGTAEVPVDVAVALTDELAMIDRSYRDAVSELVEMIGEARPEWTPSYARRYDDRVRELRARVDSEQTGKAKERAWQELMRYLQTTLTRSELAMGAP